MEIVMTLKREWFEKIKKGEKKIEYRVAKPYWDVRLNKPITSILFKNGYRKDAPKIRANVVSIALIDGINTDLQMSGMVYAIKLSNVRSL